MFKFFNLIPSRKKSFKNFKLSEEDLKRAKEMQILMDNANFHSARAIEHLSNILN